MRLLLTQTEDRVFSEVLRAVDEVCSHVMGPFTSL
jgi:hypothetical protein